jgi:hypothetical protein
MEDTFYEPEGKEEVDGWRADLTTNLAGWKKQHRALWLERKSKDRELRIAEQRGLRAGKHKPRVTLQNGQTQVWDMGERAKQNLVYRLGELEAEMEMLETLIEDTTEELAKLPPEEPEEEEEAVAP